MEMKKELTATMMSESTALIWMRFKYLFQTMMELAGSNWWLTKAQKSTGQHSQEAAEKLRKEALADVSNNRHARS
jgi:hypothetical protein